MRSLIVMLAGLCALTSGCHRTPPSRLGITVHGQPTPKRINEWTETLGITPQILVFFEQWPAIENQKDGSIPSEPLAAIHARNIIPCLSWEPHIIIDGKEEAIPYESIINGEYDPYIQRMASAIQRLKKPVWIRFAHEMNLDRYHWGVAEAAYNADTPQKYRLMFRYVVEKFRELGVQNAKWVFCPNSESIPQFDWNTIQAYWPGADVVDILGVDGYNWGTTQTLAEHGWKSDWRSFQSIFESAIRTLHALAEDKPLYVMETASVRQGGNRDQWITEMIAQAPLLKIDGFCWFQADKENAWSIDPQLDRQGLTELIKWSR
jgi:hypothetical protein